MKLEILHKDGTIKNVKSPTTIIDGDKLLIDGKTTDLEKVMTEMHN